MGENPDRVECYELEDVTDALFVYAKLGGSRALRRVIELAHKAGANRLCSQPHTGDPEWEAELDYLRRRRQPTVPEDPLSVRFLLRDPENSVERLVATALLRPGPDPTVMEAVVPSPNATPSAYYTCCVDHPLFNHPADTACSPGSITAFTFCQQDNKTGVCAHAAIRAASRTLSCSFPGCKVPTFPDISRAARVRKPSDGLSPMGMQRALLESGYDLIVFSANRKNKGKLALPAPVVGGATFPRDEIPFMCDEIVYHYQESGLPVILAVKTEKGYHALLVVGHSFEQDSWWPRARKGYYPRLEEGYEWLSTSLWATHYYIHDDNLGPYMSVPKNFINEYTRFLFIPLPPQLEVRMAAEHAEALAAYIVYSEPSTLAMIHDSNDSRWAGHVRQRQEDRKLVLRTLLVQRERFLDHIASPGSRYAPAVRDMYTALELPKYLWLVEVTLAELYGLASRKVGEILINPGFEVATTLPATQDNLRSIIALHLTGCFWPNPAASTQAYFMLGDDATDVFRGSRFNSI